MKSPIVHFEIPADDENRAMAFYQTVFAWKFNKFDMPSGEVYWGVTTTEVDEQHRPTKPGQINGGLMKRKYPDQPFMNYIQADSIDETLMLIVEHGGTVLMPKTEIALNMGWIAAFRDTEDNIMGLHEVPAHFKAV